MAFVKIRLKEAGYEKFAYQHSPYISAICDEIRKGSIGDIRYMEAALITSDYNNGNIRMHKETFGGCTYNLGVYCTSLILRVMGKTPSKVQAVSSFSESGVDMYTSALMEYEKMKG